MDANKDNKELSRTVFDCLSPNCGTVLAVIIADLLADGLEIIQIAVLATFLTSVGDNLGYIAAQRDLNVMLAERKKQKESGNNIAAPPAPK